METKIGREATILTFQSDFPVTINCTCGGEARIALAFREDSTDQSICSLHKNKGVGNFWPHDRIAVAVYFCRKCFKCLAKWSQA